MTTEPNASWADALSWFVGHQRNPLDVALTVSSGGLAVEGMALYEDVDQREGAFGVWIAGLRFWIEEAEVASVWIDPETEALLLILTDGTSLFLRPRDDLSP